MTKRFRLPGILRQKLEESGVPAASVLRRAALPRDLFDQTRILLTTAELFALWRAIGELSPDPDIGLKLSTETRIERFSPAGLAALCTGNFGAAVEQMARYKKLCAPEEIRHRQSGGEWQIEFRWLLALDSEPPALVDACFAWVLNVARRGTGSLLAPLRIEFRHPCNPVKLWERHFGCPVICGASRNLMVFRAPDAQLPFVTRNAELLEMLVPQFERELERDGAQDSFVELVRGAIQERLAGNRPTITGVAQQLRLSSRTLQRRLRESGSSFQRVLDTARHELARYYLKNPVLELNEAAYLLGYEDASSFARAFRAWEGIPPSDWRETHRARTAN